VREKDQERIAPTSTKAKRHFREEKRREGLTKLQHPKDNAFTST